MEGAGSRKVVLLVDDSPDNRAMYAAVLELSGYHVIEASDGQDALVRARECRPDAIVMDVILPVLDGCEATRALRADPVTRDIHVIAMSGRGDAPFKRDVLASGVDRFLEKPCLPALLVEHLRALLGDG